MPEEKKGKEIFVAVQVPTNHTIAIQTPEGEVISQEQALAKVLNDLNEIKTLLG